MKSEKTVAPRWIVVRLGEDSNWWLDPTSESLEPNGTAYSILHPQQIAHLLEALSEYPAHGFRHQQFVDAFRVFVFESDIAEDCLRLALTDESLFKATNEIFALPIVGPDGDGPYSDFLDTLSAARIRYLNATHHYVQECTELEMDEELNALHTDRYFGNESIHAFDEINEILRWSPAEWDDSPAS